jgi:hypothetical protein
MQLFTEWQYAYAAAIKGYFLYGKSESAQQDLSNIVTRMKKYAGTQKRPNRLIAKLITRSITLLALMGRG